MVDTLVTCRKLSDVPWKSLFGKGGLCLVILLSWMLAAPACLRYELEKGLDVKTSMLSREVTLLELALELLLRSSSCAVEEQHAGQQLERNLRKSEFHPPHRPKPLSV